MFVFIYGVVMFMEVR